MSSRAKTPNRAFAGTAQAPGGRIAALAFIALVIVVGVIALYWGITR